MIPDATRPDPTNSISGMAASRAVERPPVSASISALAEALALDIAEAPAEAIISSSIIMSSDMAEALADTLAYAPDLAELDLSAEASSGLDPSKTPRPD